MKVVLCIPTRREPFPQMVAAIDASLPLLREAGHTVAVTTEIGNAYISYAAAKMVEKAIEWGADAAVLIEDDQSFAPRALLDLVETPGDVVAGNYRYKDDSGDFMGLPLTPDGRTLKWRSDGCVLGERVPAGFLKLTPRCVQRVREAYPELICDKVRDEDRLTDIFHHGAHKGVWWGQDFAFSRRWREAGGQIWIKANLDISHWIRKDNGEYIEYRGNYMKHLAERHGVLFPEPELRAAA